jgi:hypothetical protein
MLRLCFDQHRSDGLVWSLDLDGKWINVAEVDVRVPMKTAYRPRGLKDEPSAFLWTAAAVSLRLAGSGAVIEAP